jgi:hypothetical protein
MGCFGAVLPTLLSHRSTPQYGASEYWWAVHYSESLGYCTILDGIVASAEFSLAPTASLAEAPGLSSSPNVNWVSEASGRFSFCVML